MLDFLNPINNMIKFLDLQKINAQYQQELKAAAEEVIDSGWYLLGEKLKLFESNLAEYTGTKHAIGVAGANALVTKDIPDYEIHIGSPAKFMKKVRMD